MWQLWSLAVGDALSQNTTDRHHTIQYKLLLASITILIIDLETFSCFDCHSTYYISWTLKSITGLFGIHSLATQPRDRHGSLGFNSCLNTYWCK